MIKIIHGQCKNLENKIENESVYIPRTGAEICVHTYHIWNIMYQSHIYTYGLFKICEYGKTKSTLQKDKE